jgi:glycosyltransferase involved in cell wall biosynthesis
LRSVLNQDFKDFELRVMGDGCTDGSEKIVTELNDPRLLWFNFQKNTGSQSAPNNEGMRRARGQYIAFIGHDDLWMPWHLSRLVAHLEETSADMVHDLVANVTQNGIEHGYGPPHPLSNYARVYFPTMSWVFRRTLPDEIGYWRDPNELGWAIDFDFSRRAALAGKKISFLPSLGGLKFHSGVWKPYSHTGEPGQKKWLERILNDPAQLNEEILSQLATLHAQQFQWHDRKPPLRLASFQAKRAVKDFLKAIIRDLIYAYGPDRWPLGEIRRRRLRRLRSKQRLTRGLRSLEESGL